jgi:hypothetical protein
MDRTVKMFNYCVFPRCQGNTVSTVSTVSTKLFPNNGRCTVSCLHSCYLAMSLHVTILQTFSPYLTGNTPRLHNNDQSVNAVRCEIHTEHINTVIV